MSSEQGRVAATWRKLVMCAIVLSPLAISTAHAEIGVTPTITITNGTDSNGSPASWNTWGGLDYFANPYQYPGDPVIHYDWSGLNSAVHWFYGLSDYIDAVIDHRRVLIYTPNVLIWESCPQDILDTTVLPGSGFWYRQAASTPNPIDWFGSVQNNVIYKIQSGGTPTGLSATQFTLKQNTN